MSGYDYYAEGDWNVQCYECGRKRKASGMKRHWQGYWVCPEHWEPRHPQDFVRALPDTQTAPWTQPMPKDQFVAICTPDSMSAIADYAYADCAIADYLSAEFDPTINPLPCTPVAFYNTTTVAADDYYWACNMIIVDADVTLNGFIGAE